MFEVTRYAPSGDASIAYQVGGDGPVTILISSYGTISVDAFGNEPHFARFLDGLTSFARVIRYDRRGIGLSDPIDTSDPPTLEQDVDDARAVLDHAGVEQAALFGGVMNGMGAMLTIVIGASVRHVSPDDALHAIAGYTVLNDVSVRDYQNRTLQWLQGKTFESSTPLGPELVTRDDEAVDGEDFDIECEVDGELMQKANTADLVFGPGELVSYISDIATLRPGDIIATGTPGGVGHARTPARYLEEGNVVVTRIKSIGELRNVCRKERIDG